MNINEIGVDIVVNNEMKCVHDNDLESLLKSLNVYDGVATGKYKCLFCDETITMDNLDSIVPYKGTVQFTCDKQVCHAKLLGLSD